MRQDSIRSKGLETHVNEYCKENGIEYNYDDLVRWIEDGEYGEQVTGEWIRRRFKPLTRSTFDKWVAIYKEEQSGGNKKVS